MKKTFLLLAATVLLLTGCYGPNRQFAGTMIGAHIGGALGSAIFGEHSYSGAVFGDVVGTLAGAAIGAAVTAPTAAERAAAEREAAELQRYDDDDPGLYQRPGDSRYDATAHQRRPSYRLEPVKTDDSKALADLKVKNLRFIDQDRNRVINASESCQLLFDVVNDGKATVHNITPCIYEVNRSKYIHISDPSVIGSLQPGESAHYVIQIKTDSRLQPGTATFCIELSNADGLTVPCREFDLETAN